VLKVGSATPCLPISKDTLEYGSADGGLTVLKSSKDLNRKMKLAATKMKLKGHVVGTNSPTKIYGPGTFNIFIAVPRQQFLTSFV